MKEMPDPVESFRRKRIERKTRRKAEIQEKGSEFHEDDEEFFLFFMEDVMAAMAELIPGLGKFFKSTVHKMMSQSLIREDDGDTGG